MEWLSEEIWACGARAGRCGLCGRLILFSSASRSGSRIRCSTTRVFPAMSEILSSSFSSLPLRVRFSNCIYIHQLIRTIAGIWSAPQPFGAEQATSILKTQSRYSTLEAVDRGPGRHEIFRLSRLGSIQSITFFAVVFPPRLWTREIWLSKDDLPQVLNASGKSLGADRRNWRTGANPSMISAMRDKANASLHLQHAHLVPAEYTPRGTLFLHIFFRLRKPWLESPRWMLHGGRALLAMIVMLRGPPNETDAPGHNLNSAQWSSVRLEPAMSRCSRRGK